MPWSRASEGTARGRGTRRSRARRAASRPATAGSSAGLRFMELLVIRVRLLRDREDGHVAGNIRGVAADRLADHSEVVVARPTVDAARQADVAEGAGPARHLGRDLVRHVVEHAEVRLNAKETS